MSIDTTPRTADPTGFLGYFEHDSPQWHAARAGGIGGSEVAAVLGLSPWQSPFSLWHAKANGWTSEPDPEMEWGQALEPALLDWYFDHSDSVEEVVRGGTWQHPARPWQHANPDAIGLDHDDDARGVVVEAKKAGDEHWGAPGTDDVPVHYRVQGIWYCDALRASRVDFVVTRYGRAPQIYTVDYDPAEARLIRGHAAAFWRSLRHGTPPDLDDHVDTLRTVRRLHPDIEPDTALELDETLVLDWHAKTAQKRSAERAEREANARVLDAMGPARRGTLAGRNTVVRVPSQGGAPPHLRTSRTRRKPS